MKRTSFLTALAAVLTVPLGSALAQAPGSYAYPPAPVEQVATNGRTGLVGGVDGGLGLGPMGSSYGAFRIGWMVSPRLAVLVEASGLNGDENDQWDDNGNLRRELRDLSVIGFATQFWFQPNMYIKGTVGGAEGESPYFGKLTDGMGLGVSYGYEVWKTRHLAVDVNVGLVAGIFDQITSSRGTLGIGISAF